MRRSRRNYILYSIVTEVCISIVTGLWLNSVSTYYTTYSNSYYSWEEYQEQMLLTITFLMIFLQSAIMIGLSVGRLKDMGKDPVWSWAVIIPFVWLYFAFAKGTEGDNQYGKSPKELRAEKKVQEAEQQALLIQQILI